MKGPAPMPPALGDVRIRNLLPPSALADAERCALPVMIGAPDESGTLPPAPTAVLGTVLHHVRARWRARGAGAADSGPAAAAAVDELLAEAVEETERLLAMDPRTRGLVPLESTVEEDDYLDRRMALRRWAKAGVTRVDTDPPETLALGLFGQPSDAPHPDSFATGIEPWLVANPLRLRGRPDLVVQLADGAIEITDDKTGQVVDDKGEVLDHHKVQLWFYALMVDHLRRGATIRLRVVGEASHPVAWDPPAHAKASKRLSDLLEGMPAGGLVSADDLANPGPSCRRCRLRPRCGAYLRTAPSWWRTPADGPKPVPYDAWGTVEGVKHSAMGVELKLTDPVGRVVRVRGIGPDHGISTDHRGAQVALFNLQPTQEVRLHGRWLAPTSWHESSPGRTYPPAVGLTAFGMGS